MKSTLSAGKTYLLRYYKTKEAKLTHLAWFVFSFIYLAYHLVEATQSAGLNAPDLATRAHAFHYFYSGFLGGGNFSLLFLVTGFAGNGFVYWAHKHRNNQFTHYCIQRMGRRKQYNAENLVVIFSSAIYILTMMILTHLVMFVYLLIITGFDKIITRLDLLLFVIHLISMMNFTIIFSLLVYHIGFYIKNTYLLRASGMIIFVLLILLTIFPAKWLAELLQIDYILWIGNLSGANYFIAENLAFDIFSQLATLLIYSGVVCIMKKLNYGRISRSDR